MIFIPRKSWHIYHHFQRLSTRKYTLLSLPNIFCFRPSQYISLEPLPMDHDAAFPSPSYSGIIAIIVLQNFPPFLLPLSLFFIPACFRNNSQKPTKRVFSSHPSWNHHTAPHPVLVCLLVHHDLPNLLLISPLRFFLLVLFICFWAQQKCATPHNFICSTETSSYYEAYIAQCSSFLRSSILALFR